MWLIANIWMYLFYIIIIIISLLLLCLLFILLYFLACNFFESITNVYDTTDL